MESFLFSFEDSSVFDALICLFKIFYTDFFSVLKISSTKLKSFWWRKKGTWTERITNINSKGMGTCKRSFFLTSGPISSLPTSRNPIDITAMRMLYGFEDVICEIISYIRCKMQILCSITFCFQNFLLLGNPCAFLKRSKNSWKDHFKQPCSLVAQANKRKQTMLATWMR